MRWWCVSPHCKVEGASRGRTFGGEVGCGGCSGGYGGFVGTDGSDRVLL